MQAKQQEQPSPADAEVILGRLPERIQVALVAHAAEIEYPIEAVIAQVQLPNGMIRLVEIH